MSSSSASQVVPLSLLPTTLLLTTHAHAPAAIGGKNGTAPVPLAGLSLRGPARWSDKPATRHRRGRRLRR